MGRDRHASGDDAPPAQRKLGPRDNKLHMLFSTSMFVLGLMLAVVCLLIAGVLGLVALLFNGGTPGRNYWVSLIGIAEGIVIAVSSGAIVVSRMRRRHVRERRSWRELWYDELDSRGKQPVDLHQW
jgi:hypothetical protein